MLQALKVAGGKYFVGVNFGAMDKYREPLTAEQWKNCVNSLKVRHANASILCGTANSRHARPTQVTSDVSQRKFTFMVC